MTMPVPVSPPLPVRTSSDTTLGKIFAATAATDPGARATAAAPVVVAPNVTVCGAALTSSAACTTRPPIVPASTATIPAVNASTGHVSAGDDARVGGSGDEVTG